MMRRATCPALIALLTLWTLEAGANDEHFILILDDSGSMEVSHLGPGRCAIRTVYEPLRRARIPASSAWIRK